MSDQSFIRAGSQFNDVSPSKDIAETFTCARIAHGRSKTDLKFWKGRIFKPVWQRSDGRRAQSANFAVEISFRGRRIKWTLDTPNRDAAAARAKEIYLFLQANGWEAALERYRPKETPKPKASEITVGEFLAAVRATSGLSNRTFTDYAEALRRITAAIGAVPSSNRKFDKVNGGRLQWLERVGAVRLAKITPEALEHWKRAFLAAAKLDPISQRSARVSVNSYLRRAKCLFAKEILAHLDVTLPDPLPFTGVKFEKRPNLKYHSNFDIRLLVAAARAELGENPDKVELFKMFVLAAMCGLRRREIDLLPWSAFRFEEGVLRIEATEFFQPKSDESNAELPLDPEVLSLFRGYCARAKSQFVVESPSDPQPGTSYLHYRCAKEFRELSCWLRAHGVGTIRPLHALRKEFGSLINQAHGIHAASRALRHASIGITAEIYVDSRVRTTSGLGYLLEAEHSSNVLPIPSPDAPLNSAAGQR
jgi:integrase